MKTAVRLQVLTGPHKNRRFCFCGPTRCEIGRDLECFVQLSGKERDRLVSRHHCKLSIDLPLIQVKDLGSINGTFVNGKKVEPAPKANPTNNTSSRFVITSGDLLTVGGTTLRVDVVSCPHADNEMDGKSIWKAGETAKKDCPLQC